MSNVSERHYYWLVDPLSPSTSAPVARLGHIVAVALLLVIRLILVRIVAVC